MPDAGSSGQPPSADARRGGLGLGSQVACLGNDSLVRFSGGPGEDPNHNGGTISARWHGQASRFARNGCNLICVIYTCLSILVTLS